MLATLNEFEYIGAHAALGCAASAALGTGCAGGAIGGAASAAFSPDFIKAIDPTGAPLDVGQLAVLAAFATLAGGGLAGLAGANVNGAATAAQNEALNNAGQHPGQGGLLGVLANTAYTFMPWLPGNPATQAISQAFQGPVYQPNGAANPPADDLGNVTGSSGGGNNPSAPAVVTSFAMALCAASGGEACGLMGMLSPASSSPLPPTNSTLSSGNGGNDSGSNASDQGAATNSSVGFDTSNLESKLDGYLLDPAHPQNQTKANWFSQALGFNQSNWQDLASQLYFDPATAVATKTTQYGQTYEQIIPITGTNGKTINTTFVFMKDNSGTVRLVTGIPAKQ